MFTNTSKPICIAVQQGEEGNLIYQKITVILISEKTLSQGVTVFGGRKEVIGETGRMYHVLLIGYRLGSSKNYFMMGIPILSLDRCHNSRNPSVRKELWRPDTSSVKMHVRIERLDKSKWDIKEPNPHI